MVGGVADGSETFFVPLSDGEILDIYVDGACTRDQFIDMPAALGVAGQGTPAAAMTAGTTLGVCLETTGGAGVCRVFISKVWS